MIHENFYAKYTVLKNPVPLMEDSTNNIRVSFYDNNIKVGQCYIDNFDSNSGHLRDFKIYKKYRRNGYAYDAMDWLMSHFNISMLKIEANNMIGIKICNKYSFELLTLLPSLTEDNKVYYWMCKF